MFKRWVAAAVLAVLGSGCGSSGGGGGGSDPGNDPPPVVLAGLVVAPGNVGIEVGETAAFTVTGTMSNGAVQFAAVTWSVSGGAVAQVDANGVATGLAAGTTDVIATSIANPAIHASGTLVVTDPPNMVYAADYGGIYRYPLDGGPRTAMPTGGGMKISVCPAPGGPFYLAGMDLFKVDEAAGTSTPLFTFAGTSRHLGLVRDSGGYLYTINLGGGIVKYDPIANTAAEIGSPGVMAGGLIIDGDDNLYVSNLLMFSAGDAWVRRIAPDGTDATIVECAVSVMAVGFGMTRTQDEALYLCTLDAGSTAYVYRAADSNGDGDMLDPGEVTLASGVFSGAAGTSVAGILWTGSALLVNERTIGITKLQDSDGDGLFLTGGESTPWSAEPANNGIDLTSLKLGRP